MKWVTASLLVTAVASAGFNVAVAADLKDRIKVEVQHAGLQPDMAPGLYVCAAGHLHIKATVQNLSGVAVSHVRVTGEAFNAKGELLGSASSSIKRSVLESNEKADINLEFLDIIGPSVGQVKDYKLAVVEARPKP